MSAAGTTTVPRLIGPIPPEKQLSLFKFIEVAKENQMAAFPRQAYEQPVWVMKTIFGTVHLVSDPAGVKRVLLDKVANYPKMEEERRALGAAFGDGLLVSTGEKWKSHRRIMSPSFDFRSIMSYAPGITEETAAHIESWQRRNDGGGVDIAQEMTRLTLRIISRTMFSTAADELGDLVDGSMRRGQEQLTFGLMDILPFVGKYSQERKLRKVHDTFGEMDGAMYKLIRSRSAKPAEAPKDLLDRLIAARDSETGAGMTEQEIRDEVVIIFLAGHETTALALTYAWYLLSQHPDVEAKLHAELDLVLAGRLPGYEDLENLPYTRMMIDEAMRLYPPAPGISGRVALEEDEIAGQKIPKGAAVLIAPWVVHRHRQLWDDPDRFDPERFTPQRSAGRHRFAFLPFGGGPRICIGAAFAQTEAALIVAAIAQRFRLRLVPGQDIRLQQRITMWPRDGIRMVLEPR